MPYKDPAAKKVCDAAYYLAHRKRIKDRSKKWYLEHREESILYNTKRNKDNAKQHSGYTEKYRRKNPIRYALYEHIRRTRKTRAGGSFTPEQWTVLCTLHHNLCISCGKKRKLTPDHVVPVSKGGTSDISNIQPLCGPCNSSKGSKEKDYR